jgi:uncharacterized protein with HEPN domain
MKRHDSKRDHDYLLDIIEYCRHLVELPKGRTINDFMADWDFQAAAYHGIFMIGEIVKRLSPETKAQYPMEWSSIIRMRDLLAHRYDEVDYGIVWDTLIVHVPDLLEKLTGGE